MCGYCYFHVFLSLSTRAADRFLLSTSKKCLPAHQVQTVLQVGRSRCPGAAGRSQLCSALLMHGPRSGECQVLRILPSFSAAAQRPSNRSPKRWSRSLRRRRAGTSLVSTFAMRGNKPICQRCRDTIGHPMSHGRMRRGSVGVTTLGT